jgi:hypothetical protein
MSRKSGLPHVKLLGGDGREATQAFLPLDADFWNHDATRYTLFLDPGRVKQGILPNEQLGPPLVEGGEYTIVVDSLWQDAHGRPLVASHKVQFRAAAPRHQMVEIAKWRVRAPAVGSREPLVVQFPYALDHGLLLRSLGVETARGAAVSGEGLVQRGEQEWRYLPREPWRAGEYRLVILSIVEDGAGNRIDRPFEVDMFARVDSLAAPERYQLGFVVKDG